MQRSILALLRLLGFFAMVVALAVPAAAQDTEAERDDETGGDDVVAQDTEFVVHIYQGTAEDFEQGKDSVDEIGDLELLSEYDDDPDDERDKIWDAIGEDGEELPEPFFGTDGDAEASLDELTGDPHVLIVHAGEEETAPVIAAGNIEGEVEDGTLMIDLEAVEDSGFEGRAYFGPDDARDVQSDDESGDVEDQSGGQAGEGGADEGDDTDDDTGDDTSELNVLIGLWQVAAQGA